MTGEHDDVTMQGPGVAEAVTQAAGSTSSVGGPAPGSLVDRYLLAPPPDRIDPELEFALRVALAFDPAARHLSMDPLLARLGA